MYTWDTHSWSWLVGRYDIMQNIITTIDSTSTPYNNMANYASIPLQSEHNPEWYGRFAEVNGLQAFTNQIYATSAVEEAGDYCVYDNELYCKVRTPSPARPVEFINDAADDCNPDMSLLEEYIKELEST